MEGVVRLGAAVLVGGVILFKVRGAARSARKPLPASKGKRGAGDIQFMPFQEALELAQSGNAEHLIAVDCGAKGIENITHHRTSKVQGLLGDSSTEQVLAARAAKHSALKGKSYVTTNHFDIDSFLSVQAVLLDDETVVKRKQFLSEASRIGDFREVHFAAIQDPNHPLHTAVDEGLKMCCLLNTLEREHFARPFETSDVEKWNLFLNDERVLRLLKHGDAAFSAPVWGPEYERVVKECATLCDPKRSSVRKYDDIGLAVIQTDEPMHYYALFSVVENCDVVLCCYSNGRFEIEQRYTTYVELTSRPVFPRICLTKLAKALNKVVPQENWHANRFVDSGPMLRIEQGATLTKAERYGHPFERPIYSSSISMDDMEKYVVAFFRFGLKGHEKMPSSTWPFSRMHELNQSMASFEIAAA